LLINKIFVLQAEKIDHKGKFYSIRLFNNEEILIVRLTIIFLNAALSLPKNTGFIKAKKEERQALEKKNIYIYIYITIKIRRL